VVAEFTRREIDAFVADWAAGGPRFQLRLEQLEAAEQQRAAREGRKARPVRPGRSPKTIANALVPLREMLGHAVEWDYIATNPAAGVRRPRAERRHDE
jgi:site-specific recombinase XerC